MVSPPKIPDEMSMDDYAWISLRRFPMPGNNWGTLSSAGAEQVPFELSVDADVESVRATVCALVIDLSDFYVWHEASHAPTVFDLPDVVLFPSFDNDVKTHLVSTYGDQIPLLHILKAFCPSSSVLDSITVYYFLKEYFPNGFCTWRQAEEYFSNLDM
jgi:hypothetical protein